MEFLADGQVIYMGIGPCEEDEASVWYGTDIIGAKGQKWSDAAEALSRDAGQRFTLSAVMEYPRPATTDGCAFLKTNGYSLLTLRAEAVLP